MAQTSPKPRGCTSPHVCKSSTPPPQEDRRIIPVRRDLTVGLQTKFLLQAESLKEIAAALDSLVLKTSKHGDYTTSLGSDFS